MKCKASREIEIDSVRQDGILSCSYSVILRQTNKKYTLVWCLVVMELWRLCHTVLNGNRKKMVCMGQVCGQLVGWACIDKLIL